MAKSKEWHELRRKGIGGKFEHVASGKTFDVYKYTDNDEVSHEH